MYYVYIVVHDNRVIGQPYALVDGASIRLPEPMADYTSPDTSPQYESAAVAVATAKPPTHNSCLDVLSLRFKTLETKESVIMDARSA